MLLGEKLKRLRTERGLTLSTLASASDLTKGFISQLEAGHSTPSLASLTRLATALQVLPADLISDASVNVPQDSYLRLTYTAENAQLGVTQLAFIDRAGATNYFVCTLEAGSRLVSFGGEQHVGSKALGVLRRGSVRIRQAGTDLRLSEGDVGTWSATLPCVIENNNARYAELLVCLPVTASPPSLEIGSQDNRIERRPVAAIPSEGPFRLITMRAERRLVGRT